MIRNGSKFCIGGQVWSWMLMYMYNWSVGRNESHFCLFKCSFKKFWCTRHSGNPCHRQHKLFIKLSWCESLNEFSQRDYISILFMCQEVQWDIFFMRSEVDFLSLKAKNYVAAAAEKQWWKRIEKYKPCVIIIQQKNVQPNPQDRFGFFILLA